MGEYFLLMHVSVLPSLIKGSLVYVYRPAGLVYIQTNHCNPTLLLLRHFSLIF